MDILTTGAVKNRETGEHNALVYWSKKPRLTQEYYSIMQETVLDIRSASSVEFKRQIIMSSLRSLYYTVLLHNESRLSLRPLNQQAHKVNMH